MINQFLKKLITTLKRKWVEYLLEMFVITFGIIGAFMLDSWKEKHENHKEEQVILLGLKEAFELNLSELNRNLELNQKANSSMHKLIDLLRSEQRFNDMRQIDSLIITVNMFGSFDAHTGYVDEVIGTGKLSLIQDKNLKKQLTG